MNRWVGRVALLTGASSGIGAAVSRELVKRGMIVIGCARGAEKIQKIAEEDEIKNSKGKLVAMKCDLKEESEILSMFDEIRKTYGRLDVCVNSAGLAYNSLLLSGPTADWQEMFNVNVLALSICSREAVKLMREKGINDGQIINFCSIVGHRVPFGYNGFNFYAGTKFMVRALTEGLRQELLEANTQIRVSSISPGIVATPFYVNFAKNDPAVLEAFKDMGALTTDDVVNTVVNVLSVPPHVAVHDVLVNPIDTKF